MHLRVIYEYYYYKRLLMWHRGSLGLSQGPTVLLAHLLTLGNCRARRYPTSFKKLKQYPSHRFLLTYDLFLGYGRLPAATFIIGYPYLIVLTASYSFSARSMPSIMDHKFSRLSGGYYRKVTMRNRKSHHRQRSWILINWDSSPMVIES